MLARLRLASIVVESLRSYTRIGKGSWWVASLHHRTSFYWAASPPSPPSRGNHLAGWIMGVWRSLEAAPIHSEHSEPPLGLPYGSEATHLLDFL